MKEEAPQEKSDMDQNSDVASDRFRHIDSHGNAHEFGSAMELADFREQENSRDNH